MRHRPGGRVEGQVRDRAAQVADRTQHQLGFEGLGIADRHRTQAALVRDQLVADQPDPLDPFVSDDGAGRGEETQHDPAPAFCAPRVVLGIAGGDPAEHGQLALDGHGEVAGRLELRGHLIQRQVRGVDDDVDAGELEQVEQLRTGERRLGGAAPADNDDLLDRAVAQNLQCVVGDVRGGEPLGVGGEDPGDVEGDVAVADDHGALGSRSTGSVRVVGVAVVPGDEVRGGMRAGQVLAGDPAGGRSRRRRRRRPRGSAGSSSSWVTSRADLDAEHVAEPALAARWP